MVDAKKREFDNVIAFIYNFRRNACGFMADNNGDRERSIKFCQGESFGVLFKSDKFVIWVLRLDFIYGFNWVVKIFPGNPVFGTDSAFMNAGRGGSLSGAAKINFFSGYSIGKTEKAADVIGVQNVIKDKNEGPALNLSQFFLRRAFSAQLVGF